MRTFGIVCLLFASGVPALHAQAARDVPPIFVGAVRPLQPPPETGAWVLQVLTRGGIGGRGTGDLAITSTGSLTVPATEAARVVPAANLRLLRDYVSASIPSQWIAARNVSICSDCVSTLLVLTVRTADGTVHTYSAAWDPTTKGSASADARRIHDFALSLLTK